MARKSRRTKRVRLDWVQNERSYAGQPTDIAPGLALAAAAPLVYSHQTTLGWYGTDAGAGPTQLSQAAFPNRSDRIVVRAVRGQFFVSPITGWTTISGRFYGLRLAALPSEPDFADVVVPPDYSMFVHPLNGPQEYIYADDRFLWERRFMRTFDSTNVNPIWATDIHWSGRCVLQPDEGLYLYIENAPTPGSELSGDIRVVSYLRALCEVPE